MFLRTSIGEVYDQHIDHLVNRINCMGLLAVSVVIVLGIPLDLPGKPQVPDAALDVWIQAWCPRNFGFRGETLASIGRL